MAIPLLVERSECLSLLGVVLIVYVIITRILNHTELAKYLETY